MATLEKYIFETWQDLFSYLEDKGFIFDDNKIIWDAGPNNIDAYWFHNPNHDINFYTSEGNNAFYHNLTDFEHDKYCGCIFIPLQDDGCILYLSPVDVDFDITDLQLCCINNYNSSYVAGSNPLENGVVVFTPAEADGYWRYSWRGQDPINHKWCVDNTRGIVTEGTEIPYVQIIPADLTITLLKTYLSNGSWSNYIYTQVLGDVTTPGNVFKINGQKFISITDNTTYRCPAFKLPPETVITNVSTSTEGFSSDKTYKVGDYCIEQNLLWKCVQDIFVPGPFDQGDWIITTVSNEKEL